MTVTSPFSTDFTRLHDDLPERHSQRDKRAARRSLGQLFDLVKTDEYELPKTAEIDPQARFHLSSEIDASVLRIYNEGVKLIQGTEEHRKNYRTLCETSPNCGGFNLGTAILEEATPFEQMVALDHWIANKASSWNKGRRTLCFQQGDDDYIPLYIATRKNVPATLMTVMLGAARGAHKAPRYPDFANDQNLAEDSVFSKPLECLEMARQPYFSGATILKGCAFKAEVIDHTRRYETVDSNHDTRVSQFACVELVKQNDPKTAPTKETSAGTNLVSLLKKHPDDKIHADLNYEELATDGYDDDAEIDVTPTKLWNAAKKSVRRQDSQDLDDLVRQLFVSQIQSFTSDTVRDFYAARIWNND